MNARRMAYKQLLRDVRDDAERRRAEVPRCPGCGGVELHKRGCRIDDPTRCGREGFGRLCSFTEGHATACSWATDTDCRYYRTELYQPSLPESVHRCTLSADGVCMEELNARLDDLMEAEERSRERAEAREARAPFMPRYVYVPPTAAGGYAANGGQVG